MSTPKTPEQPSTGLAFVDGRDALAFVIIRPAAADRIAVESAAHGMSKAVAAYTLRQVAEQFDAAALAEGDTPITEEEAAEEQRTRAELTAAVDRDHDEEQPAAAPDEPHPFYAVRKALTSEGALTSDEADRLLSTYFRATREQTRREEADRIDALGTARGWSTWAASYIHPDRTFVDTGEEQSAPPVAIGQSYIRKDNDDAHRHVTVTRLWTAKDDEPCVSYDIHGKDWRGRPVTSHSALRLELFERLYRPDTEEQPTTARGTALDHLAEVYAEHGHASHLARQFAAALLATHTTELAAMLTKAAANHGGEERHRHGIATAARLVDAHAASLATQARP